MPAPVHYEVRVLGRVGPAACHAFADFGVQAEPTATVLSGTLDQAALHGLIARIREHGLELVDVRRVPSKAVGDCFEGCSGSRYGDSPTPVRPRGLRDGLESGDILGVNRLAAGGPTSPT
jgi:hypothetical protein